MSANKENIQSNEKSKIPKLKERTSVRPVRKEDEALRTLMPRRDPLRTLLNQNIENNSAGPSKGTGKALDTRYVTYRNKDEETLDWNFEVFKDNLNKKINTQTDECENINNVENILTDSSTNALLKLTPLYVHKPSTELSTIKKVKKSLKRPSFRSVLGAKSPVSAKAYHCTIYSGVDCRDNVVPGSHFDQLSQEYALDNLHYLLHAEKKVIGEPKIRKASRSCVVNWIINVNGSGGHPAVVQLACWYLDAYLCTTRVTIDRLQVIAAACFWIAAKFHGRNITGRRLVKYSGNAFIENELVAAERNILRKLKFQAVPVAPHDFVPYLSWYCDQSGTGVVEAAAVFLCQCGLMIDKTLSEEYPSVVAAAAVKNALVLLRHNAWMEKLKACPMYKAVEKKASNLDSTCTQLREAVRAVSAVGYEYKAPLFKFSGPPHYISNKIVRAVNYHDILSLDCRRKRDPRQ
ncbi:G2/mitotic-specific cyclin-A-like [Pectinophora gossypiella]|uniref:G2/mitotic-specific cyclin-A-like n=1 Tax=Pectinophora gossypiella TaxID=13191 RepID=UPI00214EAFBC|nr:G2/mitotic-specific cyclin-A-like [Pectinophora gossypiella]